MTEPVHLRTDGPHSPEYTRQVADTLAEAVRVLNYATRADDGGLEYPGDAYELLASLYTAASRLPQLMAQLDAFLAAQYNTGRLVAADGGNVAGLIGGAGAHLHYAEDSARDLAARLRAAQNAIAGLGVRGD